MYAGRMALHARHPVIRKPLRTRVGFPPRAMRRSEVQPPRNEAIAQAQYGNDPQNAVLLMARWRSITR